MTTVRPSTPPATNHHQQPLPLHRLSSQLYNELQEIYKPQCREPLEALEDLEALETVEGLAGLEDLEDLAGLLLLQLPQSPQQQHQQEMQTTDSWEAYPNPLREIENSHKASLTN
jgi:hypothetical protein